MGKDRNRNNNNKDFSEQIFDLVMDSVNQMDFSGLSEQIRDTVNDAKDEFLRQLGSFQGEYKNGSPGRAGGKFQNNPTINDSQHAQTKKQRYRKNPSGEIDVSGKMLPGTWSGPVQIAAGGTGLVLFGGLSLGFGLAGAAFGAAIGSIAATTIVMEGLFLPLTGLSGFLLGKGIFTRNRARRIREYIDNWKDRSYIMLSDLAEKSGQSLGQVRKDIDYLLDKSLLPGARMDQEQTCLLLTDEAIAQYEAAKESQRIREEEERRKQDEAEQWAAASQEEKDMHSFISQAEKAMKDISHFRQSVSSDVMEAKLDRLELVLTRIFVCVKDHPEKLRLTRRLMNYYLPSVMKLLTVYEDLEKQPIQGENIIRTRAEIESSLDTLNDALETMFDELFQEEALDVSADIQVLKTMLIQDGFSPSFMQEEQTAEIDYTDQHL